MKINYIPYDAFLCAQTITAEAETIFTMSKGKAFPRRGSASILPHGRVAQERQL